MLGHVVFTWVQPRVIDTAQLAKMKERCANSYYYFLLRTVFANRLIDVGYTCGRRKSTLPPRTLKKKHLTCLSKQPAAERHARQVFSKMAIFITRWNGADSLWCCRVMSPFQYLPALLCAVGLQLVERPLSRGQHPHKRWMFQSHL